MKNKANYDNILNIEETIGCMIKRLIPLYIEDYGEEYLNLIKKRISKTLYITSSTPEEEYKHFKKHNVSLPSKKGGQLEVEYKDYHKLLKKLNKVYETEIISLIKDFSIKLSNIDDFFSLDLNSFSKDSLAILKKKSEKYTALKEEILTRQEAYLSECSRLQINPITDSIIIEDIYAFLIDIQNSIREKLVENSLWGKRIQKSISDSTGCKIPIYCLAKILSGDGGDAAINYIIVKNKSARICYFPVIRLLGIGNVDGMFYHENRHVIESSQIGSGLSPRKNCKYNIIDEIRTEKNALRDKESLREENFILNSKHKKKRQNLYSLIFPNTGTFFEDYQELLNKLAIMNDTKQFQTIFGDKNVKKFDSYLQELIQSIESGYQTYDAIADEEFETKVLKKIASNYAKFREGDDYLCPKVL